MQPAYDLLIKGGTLIDPAQGIHAKKMLRLQTASLLPSPTTSQRLRRGRQKLVPLTVIKGGKVYRSDDR